MRPLCTAPCLSAVAAILAVCLVAMSLDRSHGGDDQPKKAEPKHEYAKTLGEAANDLKQLTLGMHKYEVAFGHLLPAAVRDKNGKPHLSWRVFILPFVEQAALYKQFHLGEPWDSDHNKTLIAKMPAIFRGPTKKLNDEGKTVYLAPIEKNSAFPPDGKKLKFGDFYDGVSNTIMLVEANDDSAVVWTKPDDLIVDMKKPLTGLIRSRQDVFLVVMCDGSVHRFKNAADPTNLARVFNRHDGEVMDYEKLVEPKRKLPLAKKLGDRPE